METHAVAVALLMFLLLPLLPLLLPLTSLGEAVGRCYDVLRKRFLVEVAADYGEFILPEGIQDEQLFELIQALLKHKLLAFMEDWKWWQRLAMALALLLLLLPPLLLLLPLLLIVLLVLRVRRGLSTRADPTDTHAKRVLTILLEQGEIGLGEMEKSTISLTTTLRYAVLRIAQSVAFCFASAMSLCSGLCTTGGDEEELPEGATKYLIVEFNAWVYSGVRAASIPLQSRRGTHMHTHFMYA